MKARLAARLFGSRKRAVIASIVITVLVCVSAAAAALIIYDLTATGTAPGNAITIATTHVGALTYSSNGAAPALDSGATVQVPIKLTNNDPLVAHTVGVGLSITIADATQPASCNSHLSLVGSIGLGNGTVVPAAGSVTGTAQIALDASTPVICSGTTYTLTFTGIASS